MAGFDCPRTKKNTKLLAGLKVVQPLPHIPRKWTLRKDTPAAFPPPSPGSCHLTKWPNHLLPFAGRRGGTFGPKQGLRRWTIRNGTLSGEPPLHVLHGAHVDDVLPVLHKGRGRAAYRYHGSIYTPPPGASLCSKSSLRLFIS